MGISLFRPAALISILLSLAASPPSIPPKAQPFDLADVRLLPSPFQRAMDLDHQYLLTLPPDRLVHTFRLNANLPSTAEPLGGWEAPDSELRGHFVGHYLTAAALMTRATNDEKLKSNANAVVAALAECQSKYPSGYLSAFPESYFDRLESTGKVWAPWYTLHKVYAGLLDQYTLTGNRQALDVLEKAIAWVDARTAKLSDAQMQKTLDVEHGGMNEVLANLYAVTGNPQHLALSKRFNHHKVLDPLIAKEDKLDKLHANTQFPKVIGFERQYQLTGDAPSHAAAQFFWQSVTNDRSYVTGGNSDNEHFSPKSHLSQHLGPATTETCNTYNMLKLTHLLYQSDPDPHYVDYYERALYNHILASQHPHTGMPLYYLPLRTGDSRADGKPFGFSTPFQSFWCCTGTGVENHAKYGANIYAHHNAEDLYINLFIPSELTWKDAGITIRQETQFPESPATTLTIVSADAQHRDFTLHLRRPSWATESFTITINNQSFPTTTPAGSYAHIERNWKPGDTLTVTMPMTLRTESFQDNPNRLALLYGPLVLSADTTHDNPTAAIVTTNPSHLPELLKPIADKPLTFSAPPEVFRRDTTPDPKSVTFRPFYNNFDNPYIVYWDVMDPAKWDSTQKERQAAEARRKALAAVTIDEISFNPESEKQHNLTGQRTQSGDIYGHRWRDATDGGHFAFDLKVSPDSPVRLNCTFWGPDTGNREFDILVDDHPLTTLKLTGQWGPGLHDETYPIPQSLTQNKTSVRIKFQAHPHKIAGGSFGVRTLRPTTP